MAAAATGSRGDELSSSAAACATRRQPVGASQQPVSRSGARRRGPYFHRLQMRRAPPTGSGSPSTSRRKTRSQNSTESYRKVRSTRCQSLPLSTRSAACRGDNIHLLRCACVVASASAGRGGRWLLVEHRTVTLNEVAAAIGASSSSSDNLLPPSPSTGRSGSSSGDRVVSLKVEPAFYTCSAAIQRPRASCSHSLCSPASRESGLVLSERPQK